MPEAILVGVDASAPSRSAIAWGVARAAAIGARLELLHVVDIELLADGAPEADDVRTHAEALLRAELSFARSLDATLVISATRAEGRPAEVLARWSQGFSLLVIGTHKTGFIYGRAFGSRFLGLGWHSRCDVAFIPDRAGYARHGVVAGVDDTPSSDAVVLFAAAEAARSSQELVLISSWGSAPRAPRNGAASRRTATMSRAVALVRQAYSGLRVRTRTIEHPAAEALVEASAGADLLVIGRRRASWGNGSSRASNHDVLINMASPVIVVLDD